MAPVKATLVMVPVQSHSDPKVVVCAWCLQLGHALSAARAPQSRKWWAIPHHQARAHEQAGNASHGLCPACWPALSAAWGVDD